MNLKNTDNIIKALKQDIKKIVKLTKFDGITIECSVQEGKKVDDGIKEINKLCEKLELRPIATEKSKEKNNVFIVQFPELIPEYTEAQIKKMYNLSFKWLLDNLTINDKEHKVTPELLIKYKSLVVRKAIQIHCRSNINQYKEKLEDYLQDKKYIEKIDVLYYQFLETYKEV